MEHDTDILFLNDTRNVQRIDGNAPVKIPGCILHLQLPYANSLIDKVLSSDKLNGYWFEADWLHSKRDASPVTEKLIVQGSQVTPTHTFHDMEPRTLVI